MAPIEELMDFIAAGRLGPSLQVAAQELSANQLERAARDLAVWTRLIGSPNGSYHPIGLSPRHWRLAEALLAAVPELGALLLFQDGELRFQPDVPDTTRQQILAFLKARVDVTLET